MHVPVLATALLEAIQPLAGGYYLDGTTGLGGHAKALLEHSQDSNLCGLDRDLAALEMAENNLRSFGSRVHLLNMNFSEFDIALEELNWKTLDGAILDLGISSYQIDTPQRGFSFLHSGPLDMRMDPGRQNISARDIVNGASYETLKEYISTLGEDPLAGRIARAIIKARQNEVIDDTAQLAQIVVGAYPRDWRSKARKHPATRTFQALRMAVNQELEELKIFLGKIMGWLKPGGRLAIISFHSLEDRIIKHAMRDWSRNCICPPHVMECQCHHKARARIIFKKPVEADETEVLSNPRSSCAKLRAIEKLAD